VSKNWSAPTDYDLVCRRAAGRRRYNAKRQAEAHKRFKIVLAVTFPTEGHKRGAQAQLARELGVSRSTISRDVAKWKNTLLEAGRLCQNLRLAALDESDNS
jgi:DNA-binding transcriptional MocR family regulator